jgi:hypothetical protein
VAMGMMSSTVVAAGLSPAGTGQSAGRSAAGTARETRSGEGGNRALPERRGVVRRKAAAAVENGAARAAAGVGVEPAAAAARRTAGARVWSRRHMVRACALRSRRRRRPRGKGKWSGDGQARFDLTREGRGRRQGRRSRHEEGVWCVEVRAA